MAREFDHLDLPQLQAPLPRRRHGGGKSVERVDRAAHARQLLAEADAVTQAQLRRPLPVGATPALIFKLRLHPKANLDDDALGRFGLSVVARDEDKTLVVFSSDDDLRLFRDRVRTFGSPTGPKFGEVGGIENLEAISAEDRIGLRLLESPLDGSDGLVPVDVELWHPGTPTGARQRLAELREVVQGVGGRLSDDLIGTDLVIARCHVDADGLAVLLELDIVREVDRMPEAAVARVQALGVEVDDLPDIADAAPGSTGVLVVDSGTTANHPLLAPAMGEAQVFPDDLGQRDGLGPADGDQRLNGHGTAVSGFAAWGRPHEVVAGGRTRAEVALFSARVLDDQAHYDPDLLVEHQLESAVRYFLETYPECKVINLSLGDDRMVFREGGRQTRVAACIDELAYQWQARNVLFVVSTGNCTYDPDEDDYPNHLLQAKSALIEPATSALALTVGGVAAGGAPLRESKSAGRRPVSGGQGHPSPFTRAGFGVGGMLKPDLVELAGDYALDPRAPAKLDRSDPGLGLPTTNRDFLTDGRLLRTVVGTSFAAPAVSHAAALLFNRYPDASPNLVRALLADSAQLPDSRPKPLDGVEHDDDVLRVFGYGRPDVTRAAKSETNDVLLVAESTIAPDSFQLFEVPLLPSDFLGRRGDRAISVTLAFDPPTRHTRGDSYLGLTMQFHLFRNSTTEEIAAAFRDWREAPAGDRETQLDSSLGRVKGGQRVDLHPGARRRSKGTLQRGRTTVKSPQWGYDGGPLILAVSCLRKWAPPELNAQRFAAVVSLKHSDPKADLYGPLRARLQPRIRARARS